MCSSSNSNLIYEGFKNFILNEYTIKEVYNKDELMSKINFNTKFYKQYKNVDYNSDGKARLISISSTFNNNFIIHFLYKLHDETILYAGFESIKRIFIKTSTKTV